MSVQRTLPGFTRAARSILSNKKGALGLSILLAFIFVAVFADSIAPHEPDEINLAEGFAYPIWFSLLPQYKNLPRNIELNIQSEAWSVQGNCTEFYMRNGWITCRLATTADVETANVTMTYSFEYPYSPPKNFYSEIPYIVSLSGSSGSVVRIRLYIIAPEGKSYLIYDTRAIASNVSRIDPPASVDSRDVPLKLALGFMPFDELGEKIFSSRGVYMIRISIIATLVKGSNLSVILGPLRFRIPGLLYGVLGTDNLGGDIFSNLVYGTRVSLFVGVLASVVSVSLGLIVGILAGYKGGIVDQVLMFFTDTLMFIPLIPLLVAVSVFIGKNLYLTILLIALFSWMGFARNCRAYVMSLRERLFVEAAKAMGASDQYILFRHILPLLTPVIYITLVLNIPGAILLEASLSFLNLGDPRVPSWGRMLYNARYSGAFSRLLWWWIVPPGLMITLLAMSFVLIGQTLDEVFNPKLRARRLA